MFIDNPIPEEWNIAPSCKECNNSFSQDEQFVACVIEYLRSFVYYNGIIQRKMIQKTFEKRPQILQKIQSLCKIDKFNLTISSEVFDDIEKVALKVAKGHLIYECNQFLSDDVEISIMFKSQMDDEVIRKFNSALQCSVLPEIGSRGSNQICFVNNMLITTWKVIDEKNYRYLISNDGIVRIVIREFLYIEICY